MPSPFYCCSRINDPAYFVGRERELNRIFAALETAHTGQLQSVSIVGPRRSGRSSLLSQLTQTYAHHLRQPERYLFAYVELLSGRYSTRHGLLTGILDHLNQQLPTGADDLDRALQRVGRDKDMTLAEFEEAIQHFQRLPPQPLFPVICLDEFEQLARYPETFPKWLYDSWRSLINGGHAAFVITSTRPLYELAEEEKLTSQFFNIFLDYIPLGDFTEAEAYRLAERGRKCDRPFADEDVQRMLAWAGRHPLKLQQAGISIYHAKGLPEVNWRRARRDYQARVRQNFGQRPRLARFGRWSWRLLETIGAAILFWKGTEHVDRRVHRLIGGVALLLCLSLVILFLASPLFRQWTLTRIGMPPATPLPPTPTP